MSVSECDTVDNDTPLDAADLRRAARLSQLDLDSVRAVLRGEGGRNALARVAAWRELREIAYPELKADAALTAPVLIQIVEPAGVLQIASPQDIVVSPKEDNGAAALERAKSSALNDLAPTLDVALESTIEAAGDPEPAPADDRPA